MNIFELVGKLTIDGADKAEKQLGGLQNKVQGMAKGLRIAGAAMTVVGGIITGVAVKSVIAYAKMGDEVHKMSLRTGFATETLSRLKYAAGLGGASLATVEKAAKRMAATIYDAGEGLSTAVDALDNLGLSVEDFEGLSPEEQFMKLAEAIASVEDPSKRSALAQRIFGRAGTEMLPMLEKGTEGLKEMMAEAEKFAPIFDKEAAEAAAKLTDTMGQLKGTMDKVKLVIAEKLVPAITPLLEKLRDTIGRVSEWMEKNPGLTRTITIVSVAIGGILLVLGPLLIMLPSLVGGLHLLGAAFTFALGPIGLIILGIAALVAAGIVLWKNWDKVTAFFEKAFINLRIAILTGVEKILGGLSKFASWIPFLGDKIQDAHDAISNMIDAEKVKKAARAAGDALEDLARASALATDEMIDNVRDLTNEAKDSARERTRTEINAIDDRMRVERDAHQERMEALRDEYDQTIKTIDAELNYTLKGYQSEIDAIDDRIEATEDAEREQRDAERKAELEVSIAEAKDADERKRLEQKLADFLLEIQRRRIRRELEDEKDALRQQMAMAREEAHNAKDQAQKTYDYKRKLQEQEFVDLLNRLNSEKEMLDAALEEKLRRYDEDLEAFETLLAQEEEDTAAFVVAYNELMAQLKDKTVTITTVHRDVYVGGGDGGGWEPGGPVGRGERTPIVVAGMQHGGAISEPTLLFGLRSLRPYAIAGEKGKEYVTPGLPGISIYIAEMNVRDDRDIDLIAERLVNRIRLRTGVKI